MKLAIILILTFLVTFLCGCSYATHKAQEPFYSHLFFAVACFLSVCTVIGAIVL